MVREFHWKPSCCHAFVNIYIYIEREREVWTCFLKFCLFFPVDYSIFRDNWSSIYFSCCCVNMRSAKIDHVSLEPGWESEGTSRLYEYYIYTDRLSVRIGGQSRDSESSQRVSRVGEGPGGPRLRTVYQRSKDVRYWMWTHNMLKKIWGQS